MDRRVSGLLMLVVALLVVLVVPKILNPPVTDGLASIEPPPGPPAVGDCVLTSGGGYSVGPNGQVTPLDPAAFVPCDDPHTSEVVFVVQDYVPVAVGPEAQQQSIDDVFTECVGPGHDAWSYLGLQPASADEWEASLSISYSMIGPDDRQLEVGQSWVACLLALESADRVDQPLRGIAGRLGGVPPQLGMCTSVTGGTDPEPYVMQSSCTLPHDTEIFGTRLIELGSTVSQDELDARCQHLVVDATGRADLTAQPDLTIASTVFAYDEDFDARQVSAPIPPGTQGWAGCNVETSGGRQLTASLRMIGDAPLPWK